MKRTKGLIVGCIYAISLCGTNAASQTVETQSRQYTFLKVQLKLNFDTLQLGRKESRVFTPVISDGKNSRALHPVVVNGKWQHRMYLRGWNIPAKDALVLKAGKHTEAVEYTDSCLYSPWMKGAGVWLAEDKCGCGGEVMEQSLQQLSVIREKDIQVVELPLMAPAKSLPDALSEHRQHKTVKVTLNLDYLAFPINRTEILPEFGNNRKELQKLKSALDSLLTMPHIHIELVNMTGYASIDGPSRQNEKLAYGRTLALRTYLETFPRYRAFPYRTASIAEDWEGLKQALENTDMPYKEELLMIIAADQAPDTKEKNIKSLDAGKAYEILKRDFLPQLRRTVCEIHYLTTQKE